MAKNLIRTSAVGVLRSIILLGVSVLAALTLTVFAAGFALSFGLGLIFLIAPAVRLVRRVTGLARRLAGRWSTVDIATPYAPPPLPPVAGPDGRYQGAGRRYRSPRYPAFEARLSWLLGDVATWRDILWLWSEPNIGAGLAGLPLLLIGAGVATAILGWPWLLLALPLIVAGFLIAPFTTRVYVAWARLLLAPSRTTRLVQQVARLDEVRVDAADSQAAQLRRIERDLHDGAQARLIAVGLQLSTVERLMDQDPAAARAVLVEARESSARALRELRDLVRGIHPPVLAERGILDAVRALALDASRAVHVTGSLAGRPDAAIETAAYFAVAELLANAVKHSDARRIGVDLQGADGRLQITVTDDGGGGADPERGGGLHGVRRRLAAVSGTLVLDSPPGGPTRATVTLPWGLAGAPAAVTPMPRRIAVAIALCFGLAWLPLFPQGLVSAGIKLFADFPPPAWFFPLRLPEPYQWPVIAAMILLGAGMYLVGFALTRRYRRAVT